MDRAVFLDRDGTIIEDVGYLDDCSKMKFLPGAIEAIKLLNNNGFKVIIVTNQAGIARGYFTEEKLNEINGRMLELMSEQGAHIDKIYYCPHHIDGTVEKYRKECNWRKPNPGMIANAAREFDVDLKNSFMVGDKISDVETGRRAGCLTIWLTNSNDYETVEKIYSSDYISPRLFEAVQLILAIR